MHSLFPIPKHPSSNRVSRPDVARRGHLVLRPAAYTVFLSSVLFGSFFITLWLTEPQVPNAPDNHLLADGPAADPISSSSDLAKSAYEAELSLSQRLSGRVDGIRRIDEQKVQVRGSPEVVTIEARDTSVEDVLAALSRAFDMDYQSSIDLDKPLYGTYVGPLSQVLTRILQGYNFVLKTDNRRIVVTVVSTLNSLAANPSPPGLPASGAPRAPAPEPQQTGAPAPAPPIPQQTGAPAPAPVPQQSGGPAPAPVPRGLGSATMPAPIPGSSSAITGSSTARPKL
jgi:hypothetical protein